MKPEPPYLTVIKSNFMGPNKAYRFSFNGKENDNEVKGDGNQQDYGFRIYDNRLGRFLSVDPLTSKYPELSTYQFASNTPIWAIDLDGLEAYPITRQWNPQDMVKFGHFITAEISRIYNAQDAGVKTIYTVYNCAELVVTMYIRYAMAQGLPVEFYKAGNENTIFSSTDTKGVPQWVPGDPEGSKQRFEDYVRKNTNCASLRKSMVPIKADQVKPGDAQVTKKHAMLIRPTTEIDQPIMNPNRHHYVDASLDSQGGINGIKGSFIHTPFDAPIFKTNLFRFKEMNSASAMPIEIESKKASPLPISSFIPNK